MMAAKTVKLKTTKGVKEKATEKGTAYLILEEQVKQLSMSRAALELRVLALLTETDMANELLTVAGITRDGLSLSGRVKKLVEDERLKRRTLHDRELNRLSEVLRFQRLYSDLVAEVNKLLTCARVPAPSTPNHESRVRALQELADKISAAWAQTDEKREQAAQK